MFLISLYKQTMNCTFSIRNIATYLIGALIAAFLASYYIFKKIPYHRIALVAVAIVAIRYLFYFCTI